MNLGMTGSDFVGDPPFVIGLLKYTPDGSGKGLGEGQVKTDRW